MVFEYRSRNYFIYNIIVIFDEFILEIHKILKFSIKIILHMYYQKKIISKLFTYKTMYELQTNMLGGRSAWGQIEPLFFGTTCGGPIRYCT